MRLFIIIVTLLPASLTASIPPRIESLRKTIYIKSEKYNLNPALVAAIIFQESSGRIDVHEYSRDYTYFYKPKFFANMHSIPLETELEGQRTSYSLMQIKCSTARYLGFHGKCQNLYNASLNIEYGVKYLRYLKDIHKSDAYMVSSYNQGYPYKLSNGRLKNFRYVNSVLKLQMRFQDFFPKIRSAVVASVDHPILNENKEMNEIIPFEVSRINFSPIVSNDADMNKETNTRRSL